MTAPLYVPTVPFALAPSAGSAWVVDDVPGTVRVTAPPRTDVFLDPRDGVSSDSAGVLNAPTLLGTPPAGDFQLTARVTVDFAATFDAGVLLLHVDDRHWGKLCFEYSPDGVPLIVSVVTRGVSDDANGFAVDGNQVWLRVSRIGAAYAYHASLDGTRWSLVRHFALADPQRVVTVGFEGQSPTGDGCAVTFDRIGFTPTRLGDLRDGS
ncbi:DUF1349 domain-containing protein [Cellulomonas dongxiuzhuiae]|uniref:DUF1349 domain-containing protein n=1 Tax=Cellulomonas dongxiuzhuiae TaxID=2819979 RepID=A0ABX8GF64_9CELL|nr:DUF1349 domain-containing protein [Cellulomonas dongxiuzhuiae]MBO3093654.1 DUF1349 domain-containing protein [Cellulomonas dongxiuzhuiae]QWC14768.1 DUF1349 domain-containing protein [Cellulomonas dongxiuzhuiae]